MGSEHFAWRGVSLRPVGLFSCRGHERQGQASEARAVAQLERREPEPRNHTLALSEIRALRTITDGARAARASKDKLGP